MVVPLFTLPDDDILGNIIRDCLNENTEEKFVCPYCNQTHRTNKGLRLHTIECHIEDFFSSMKHPNQDLTQFQNAIAFVFVGIRARPSQNKATVLKQWACPHCPETRLRELDVKDHMLVSHYQVLVTKLKELQENADFVKGNETAWDCASNLQHGRRKRSLNASSTGNVYRTCDCGAQLGNKNSWYNHRSFHCKLKKSGLGHIINPTAANSGTTRIQSLNLLK